MNQRQLLISEIRDVEYTLSQYRRDAMGRHDDETKYLINSSIRYNEKKLESLKKRFQHCQR